MRRRYYVWIGVAAAAFLGYLTVLGWILKGFPHSKFWVVDAKVILADSQLRLRESLSFLNSVYKRRTGNEATAWTLSTDEYQKLLEVNERGANEGHDGGGRRVARSTDAVVRASDTRLFPPHPLNFDILPLQNGAEEQTTGPALFELVPVTDRASASKSKVLAAAAQATSETSLPLPNANLPSQYTPKSCVAILSTRRSYPYLTESAAFALARALHRLRYDERGVPAATRMFIWTDENRPLELERTPLSQLIHAASISEIDALYKHIATELKLSDKQKLCFSAKRDQWTQKTALQMAVVASPEECPAGSVELRPKRSSLREYRHILSDLGLSHRLAPTVPWNTRITLNTASMYEYAFFQMCDTLAALQDDVIVAPYYLEKLEALLADTYGFLKTMLPRKTPVEWHFVSSIREGNIVKGKDLWRLRSKYISSIRNWDWMTAQLFLSSADYGWFQCSEFWLSDLYQLLGFALFGGVMISCFGLLVYVLPCLCASILSRPFSSWRSMLLMLCRPRCLRERETPRLLLRAALLFAFITSLVFLSLFLTSRHNVVRSPYIALGKDQSLRFEEWYSTTSTFRRFFNAHGQAFLYRFDNLPGLTNFFRQFAEHEPEDHLLKRFASGTGQARLLVVPSLAEHVGLISTMSRKNSHGLKEAGPSDLAKNFPRRSFALSLNFSPTEINMTRKDLYNFVEPAHK